MKTGLPYIWDISTEIDADLIKLYENIDLDG